MWENAATFAAGLRVPKPYGDYIMLEILQESGGVTLAFSDEVILASLQDCAKNEGIFLSPDGAAATAAYDHLLKTILAAAGSRGAVQHRRGVEVHGCHSRSGGD